MTPKYRDKKSIYALLLLLLFYILLFILKDSLVWDDRLCGLKILLHSIFKHKQN